MLSILALVLGGGISSVSLELLALLVLGGWVLQAVEINWELSVRESNSRMSIVSCWD